MTAAPHPGRAQNQKAATRFQKIFFMSLTTMILILRAMILILRTVILILRTVIQSRAAREEGGPAAVGE